MTGGNQVAAGRSVKAAQIRAPQAGTDLSRIIETLKGGVLDLRQYCPIPGYVAVNEKLRTDLLKLRDRLSVFTANPKASEPLTVLLCAPSGTGKSTLVKCMVTEFDEPFELVKEDISETYNIDRDVRDFLDHIRRLRESGKRVVGFLDEVDSTYGDRYAYRHLINPMKSREFSGVVFFFGASSADNSKAYLEYLRRLPKDSKGVDFFNRLQEKLDFPEHLLEDPMEKVARALVIASQNSDIDSIDGASLAYFATKDFASCHEIENLVKKALGFMAPGAKIFGLGRTVETRDFGSFKEKFPDILEIAETPIIPVKVERTEATPSKRKAKSSRTTRNER